MNFIEALLEDIADVSAAEMIDVALEKWGELECPHVENEWHVYPQFINDLLHIAYLDKAVHLQGLEYFVLRSDHIILQNTIYAFRKIGDNYDADLLQMILEIDEIRQLYVGEINCLPKAVSDTLILLETAMYFSLEHTNMWLLLEHYVEKEIQSYSLHTKNGYKN